VERHQKGTARDARERQKEHMMGTNLSPQNEGRRKHKTSATKARTPQGRRVVWNEGNKSTVRPRMEKKWRKKGGKASERHEGRTPTKQSGAPSGDRWLKRQGSRDIAETKREERCLRRACGGERNRRAPFETGGGELPLVRKSAHGGGRKPTPLCPGYNGEKTSRGKDNRLRAVIRIASSGGEVRKGRILHGQPKGVG